MARVMLASSWAWLIVAGVALVSGSGATCIAAVMTSLTARGAYVFLRTDATHKPTNRGGK